MECFRQIYLKQSQQIIDFLKKVEGKRDDDCQHVKVSKISPCSKTGKIIVKNKNELIEIMGIAILLNGYEYDLDFIDVSNVEDFSDLFFSSNFYFLLKSPTGEEQSPIKGELIDFRPFNGSIKTWDVRNGKNFNGMFFRSDFNKHELNFNFEKAEYAKKIFYGSKYDKAFKATNIKRLKNMEEMFIGSNIKQPIYMDLSNVDCCLLGAFDSEQITAQQLSHVKFPKKAIKSVKEFVSLDVLKDENKSLSLTQFLEGFSPEKMEQFLNLERRRDNEANLHLIEHYANNINKLTTFGKLSNLKKEVKDCIEMNIKNNVEHIFKQINYEFENIKKNKGGYTNIFWKLKGNAQKVIKYYFKHFIDSNNLLEKYKEIIVYFNWNEDKKLQNKSEKQFEIRI